jgi:hypothetical protein
MAAFSPIDPAMRTLFLFYSGIRRVNHRKTRIFAPRCYRTGEWLAVLGRPGE